MPDDSPPAPAAGVPPQPGPDAGAAGPAAPQAEAARARRATAGRRVAVWSCGVLVVATWVLLHLWGLGLEPYHTMGEPREALVVWEMTHGGGWVLPRVNGSILPSKPPLFHWLGALTSLLAGRTDEWSTRLPSAALSLLALLGVYAAGCALWNARAALIAALVLASTFEWSRAATGARVDMTLTVALTMALLALLFFLRNRWPGWLIPLYLGVALAVLAKGPVGLVLPGAVALVMFAVRRDCGYLRQMRLLRGAVLIAIVAGTWYALALWAGGREFFVKQILYENLFRVVDQAEFDYAGHRHSALYLLGALLLGMLPWTLFLPGIGARLWRQRGEIGRDDVRLYLLVWSAIVFAFYTVSVSKRGVYLLGLYPAVALLLGWWWDEQARAPVEEERWLARPLPWLAWGLVGVISLIILVALLELGGVPVCACVGRWLPTDAQAVAPVVGDALRSDPRLLFGSLLVGVASFVVCARAARSARWTAIFVGMFLGWSAVHTAVRVAILPEIATRQSLQPFMARVRRVVAAGDDLAFYKTFVYGAVYYWRGHIPAYDGTVSPAPRYLLMWAEEWDKAGADLRGRYERVTVPTEGDIGDARRLVLVRRTAE